jgi:hypothetical protein
VAPNKEVGVAANKFLVNQVLQQVTSAPPLAGAPTAALPEELTTALAERKVYFDVRMARRNTKVEAAMLANFEKRIDMFERLGADAKDMQRLKADLIMLTSPARAPPSIEARKITVHSWAVGKEDISAERLKRIGVRAAELYRDLHGRNPPISSQLVEGALKAISTYSEEDVELLEKAFKTL